MVRKIKIHTNWSPEDFSGSGEQSRISELISILKIARSTSNMSPLPSEVVFLLLKDLIAFAISHFGSEHRDIRVRNPELRIVYRPTMFHSLEGTREIDTGLPKSIKRFARTPQTHLRNEMLEEFFTNILQDIIDVQDIYLKKGISLDFEKLIELLETRRRKPAIRRPDSSVELISSLRKEIRNQKATIFYLRRKITRVTRTNKK